MLIKEIVERYLLELPNKRKTTEFPTGIEQLDKRVWFSRKNVNIVAGRPSNNKSTFILNNLAVPAAENGMKVIIYSLEDTKSRYALRYLACKSGIVNYDINRNNVNVFDIERLKMYKDAITELPLDICEDRGYVVSEIEEDLQTRNPDMVIIDYINKIKTINNNRLDTVNDYLRRFSILTKKKNFCGVICCQVNREAMGEGNTGRIKPPMLHHIKESGDIEQVCDVAILLHWEYKYGGADRNKIQLIIAKNKDGECGFIEAKIEPEYNRMTSIN
jgi:replicative DNA helicase